MKVLASASRTAAVLALTLPASADVPPPKNSQCTVSDSAEVGSGPFDGWLALGAVALGRRR